MKIFRCKNLLVTGGAGFIGSNFIKYIFDNYKGIKVYNLDLLTYAGDLKNTIEFNDNSNYKFIKGNICDKALLNKIFFNYKIDGVINFAAESHVDNSITNPDIFIKTNINGVFNLLNVAFKYWMHKPHKVKDLFEHSRFHQASTDEVFGSIESGSFTENSPYNPSSPYSGSKAAADHLVRSFYQTYGLNTSISISSNNFGKNQHKEKLIPKVINCLKNKLPIPIYGDGQNIRNWISVEDNCSGIDLVFNNSISGKTYNIAGTEELTNLEVIEIISKILKIEKVEINFIDDRFGHDKRYSVNTNKIRRDLSWVPKFDFQDKITDYINSEI
tara:strand:- start:14138 stop:15124 length:987 start_codon:yes stop_codon:yes gene_type:complete